MPGHVAQGTGNRTGLPSGDHDLEVERGGRDGRDSTSVHAERDYGTCINAVEEHRLGVITSTGVDEEIAVAVRGETQAVELERFTDSRRRVLRAPGVGVCGSNEQRGRDRPIGDEPMGRVPITEVLDRDREPPHTAGRGHADLRHIVFHDVGVDGIGVGVVFGGVAGVGIRIGVVFASVVGRGAGAPPRHAVVGLVGAAGVVVVALLAIFIAEVVAGGESEEDDGEGTELNEIAHCF